MMNSLRQTIINFKAIVQMLGTARLRDICLDRFNINPQRPFSKFDRLLIISPHPDDDVLGCGGAMKLAIRAGASVKVIYLTDGRHGSPTGKTDLKLIKIRQNEARRALEILGVTQYQFLGFSDGNFTAGGRARRALIDIINKYRPTAIFVPWIMDENYDHVATIELFVNIARRYIASNKAIWQYEVWSPLSPNFYLPAESVYKLKAQAIRAHKSQCRCRLYDEAVIGLNKYRGVVAALGGPAEAYYISSVKKYIDLYQLLKK